MFRPLTFILLVMACASGLYLYQVKHRAQVVDREISHTVKAIEATRAQVRELSATWTLEGNPSRLQDLVTQFLPDDRPVRPNQFVSLADLDTKLPAPRPLDAAPATPLPDGGSPTGLPAGVPDSAADIAMSGNAVTPVTPPPASPVPTAPTKAPAPVIAAVRPADRKPVDTPRPARDVASAPTPAPARIAPRPAVVAELDRPGAPPRVTAAAPAPIPRTGSLLGMAHGGAGAPPPPRPLPTMVPAGGGNL